MIRVILLIGQLPRRVLAALAVALACSALASCARAQDPSELSPAQRDRFAGELRTAVAALPGIVNSQVAYRPGATLEATDLTISFEQPTGPAADPIVRDITRLAWTSPLRPLPGLRITIGRYATPDYTIIDSNWTDTNVAADLTRRYGPRPTTTPTR